MFISQNVKQLVHNEFPTGTSAGRRFKVPDVCGNVDTVSRLNTVVYPPESQVKTVQLKLKITNHEFAPEGHFII